MNIITNWKKKYNDLLNNHIFKALDLIEDCLEDEDINTSEIKRLAQIYISLSKEDAELMITLHKQALADTEHCNNYKKTNLCKRRNVYIPIIENELAKLNKENK